MDQLIQKYKNIERSEKILLKRMNADSNRLKNYRDTDGSNPAYEAELQASYENSRDALGEIRGRLNMIKTEISRQVRWRYERML